MKNKPVPRLCQFCGRPEVAPKQSRTKPFSCGECLASGKGELLWMPVPRVIAADGYANVLVSPTLGRWVDKHGQEYTRPLHKPRQKPYFEPEHRLVMEQKLGRPLERGEIVHHINGIRHDNTTDNLELCTRFQPHGQRVGDLVAYCQSFLAKYDKPA
jgi:hypothetical protein